MRLLDIVSSENLWLVRLTYACDRSRTYQIAQGIDWPISAFAATHGAWRQNGRLMGGQAQFKGPNMKNHRFTCISLTRFKWAMYPIQNDATGN